MMFFLSNLLHCASLATRWPFALALWQIRTQLSAASARRNPRHTRAEALFDVTVALAVSARLLALFSPQKNCKESNGGDHKSSQELILLHAIICIFPLDAFRYTLIWSWPQSPCSVFIYLAFIKRRLYCEFKKEQYYHLFLLPIWLRK